MNNKREKITLFTEILKKETIPALTLTQPWSTLMALGAKRIETRSWSTPYRGVLAFHAARRFPKQAEYLCDTTPFEETLQAGGYSRKEQERNWWDLPLGQVLAVGILETVRQIQPGSCPESPEYDFGDYSPSRYAWHFSAIYRLKEPIAAKGSLGLWRWQPPESFWQEVQFGLDALRQEVS